MHYCFVLQDPAGTAKVAAAEAVASRSMMANAHYGGAVDSSTRGEMDELLVLLEEKDSDLRRAAELGTCGLVGFSHSSNCTTKARR